MSFENLIGNQSVKNILNNAISKNLILHSYMFVGNSGIGKSLFAMEFAKMILCQNNDEKCNDCSSCIKFESGNNPDFFRIDSCGKSIKIEQIREMQVKVIEKPIISNKKVYIINDADLMTVEAQNCLLKTLEEPPEYIVIILIVSNENKILNTIKSRCMKINFKQIDDIEIKKYISANFNVSNVDDNILKLCNGSIGEFISIKDRLEEYSQIDKIFLNMNNSINAIMNEAELIYKNKEIITDYLEYMSVVLYKKCTENLYSNEIFINCINIIEDTKKRLYNNGNYDMCIDNLLISMWEEFNEKGSRS